MTAPVPETTPPEPPRAGRLGWRRVIFAGLLGIAGGFGVVHAVGGTMSAWIAGGSAAVGAGGYAAYKYPHVRQHFWGPWSAKARERRERRRQGRKGFSEAWQKNWRKGFKSPGNPLKNVRNPFRRSPGQGGGRRGAGSMFRRRAGAGPGRGRGAFRSPGANRRARAGSGSRSRRSGTGTGRRAGIFRRSGRGAGASRRSSPGSGRSRRLPGILGRSRRRSGTGGTGTGPRRRRTSFRPFGGRRRSAGAGGGRPRTPRPGRTRSRTPFHPFGGRRTTPRPGRSGPRSVRHPFGGRRTGPRAPRPGRSGPRSVRHPFGGGRTGPRKWFRPGWYQRGSRSIRTRARRAATAPFRWHRRGWHMIFGTPSSPRLVRRAWHRVFGTPAARRMRRRAARARRANARTRRRRTAGSYGRRPRWYAPWRGRSRRGRVPWRHRIGNWLGNRRARGLRYRGLLAGTGRTPFRLRLRHWRAQLRGFSFRRWLANRRRNRRMPRPLLSGRHRAGAQSAALHRFGRTRLGRWIIRRDRRRRQRWASRQRPGRATPVPATRRRPVTPVAAGTGGGNRNMPTGTSSGMNVRQQADQIREAGAAEFVSPNHVHDVLTSMHQVIQSTQVALANIGRQVHEQPGIIQTYGDAAYESAGAMSGAADALEQIVGPGITGRGATGSGLRDVAEDIRSMGSQEFEDSDDVHNTLIDLHTIVEGTQEAMYTLGHKIAELPGVVPEYSAAAFEAAARLSGIAENLQSKVGQGVTGQGPV